MASEITASGNVSISKNGATAAGNKSLTLDLSGNNFSMQNFVTSTSGALVPVGGLTTYGGYFMIVNNDASLSVGIYQDGATATVLISTLLAGEFMIFKPAAAVGCKAASGAPEIGIVCSEP